MTKDLTGAHSPPRPTEIKAMFNAIAPTYDFLNHLLSFGLDIQWRRKAIRLLEEKRGGSILDIAAGSGDFSIDALQLQPQRIVSTDFAYQMLEVFDQKLRNLNQKGNIHLASCDALSLPFSDGSFDVTLVAFGIRNFSNRLTSLQEMHRVLKPNGISLVLELTTPTTPGVALLYRLYSKGILPLIGNIISRHNSAYRYLPQSIANFPKREEFLAMMKRAGYAESEAVPLTFGAATIFLGRKA